MAYLCPLCQQALELNQQTWCCPQRHQFDRAKEGYVNLLPVQHKHSKQPGDNAEMIQARRDFLDAGHYRPLQQRIASLLNERLDRDPLQILDIGCGEGYYTAEVSRCLNEQKTCHIYGLDVAKVAIRAAAKRYKGIQFCVASSQRLPFADASMDAVLRIYAPCNGQELARVIKPGGLLLTVTPGPRHLVQLKALIYQEVKLHPLASEKLPHFQCIANESLAYVMTLTGHEACALLQMTPFAWRAQPETWQQLAAVSQFVGETDFTLTLWQRSYPARWV